MQSVDDIGLLQQYAATGSEGAFEALVNRRIGFVYSAALRQVRNPQMAEEVTQTVFIILARKAATIPADTTLAGWLFNTTRFTALAQIRVAIKGRRREEEIHMQTQPQPAPPEELWQQLAPMLDEALAALAEKDRQALLLRFFEDKTLAEVGNSLGAGEDAARKRIDRALEKLHGFFRRRGISSTTALLGTAISTYSVHAAPVTLAKSVTLMALAKGAVAGGSTFTLLHGALKIMALTKTQTAAATFLIIGLATVSVVQHQSQARLLEQNQTLRQQVEALQANSVQVAQANAAPTPQTNPSEELLRLRGEVGVLRQQSNEMRSLLARAQQTEAHRLSPAHSAQQTEALSEDYPKTPEAATKGMFEILSRGDFEGFFTNFAEPGVPREMYDKVFNTERIKSYLAGLEVVSVGQPTNSFGPNMWFVPYKIRLGNGTEKEMQLHIGQDPHTQKWFFKGGI